MASLRGGWCLSWDLKEENEWATLRKRERGGKHIPGRGNSIGKGLDRRQGLASSRDLKWGNVWIRERKWDEERPERWAGVKTCPTWEHMIRSLDFIPCAVEIHCGKVLGRGDLMYILRRSKWWLRGQCTTWRPQRRQWAQSGGCSGSSRKDGSSLDPCGQVRERNREIWEVIWRDAAQDLPTD